MLGSQVSAAYDPGSLSLHACLSPIYRTEKGSLPHQSAFRHREDAAGRIKADSDTAMAQVEKGECAKEQNTFKLINNSTDFKHSCSTSNLQTTIFSTSNVKVLMHIKMEHCTIQSREDAQSAQPALINIPVHVATNQVTITFESSAAVHDAVILHD